MTASRDIVLHAFVMESSTGATLLAVMNYRQQKICFVENNLKKVTTGKLLTTANGFQL
jgi:hypothetical protein